VSLAYDYEQSTHPRRAPSTTPPLVDGHAPKPVAFNASTNVGTVTARGEFSFDPTRRTLAYSVRVTGVPSSRVYSVSIDRSAGAKKGPVIRAISGPGTARATGTLKLGEAERRDLLDGKLALVVYTTEQPRGMIKASMVLPDR